MKNNLAKFDPDFMFQLTKEEFQILMSKKSTSSWGGRRKLPRAFTEQGIYMLMTVLKGDLAIAQSKALIRTFRSMKDYIIENHDLLGQRQYLQLSMISTQNTKDILDLRRDLDKVENQMADVVSSLGEVVTHSELAEFMVDFGNPKIRTGYLILNGEPVEADLAYAEIYGSAHHSVYVIDNYIGLKTLVLMKNVPEGIPITLFSDNTGNRLRRTEYEDFLKEYPNVKVNLKQTNGRFHDRYIIIDYGKDSEKIFHCGASSKDAGKKVTTITEVPEKGIYQGLIEEILQEPVLELT